MNEAELRQEILGSLGHPIVCIELKPEMLRQVLNETYRWFNAYKGLRARTPLVVSPGTNEYTLPANVLDVIEVYPPKDTSDLSYMFLGGAGDVESIVVNGIGFGGATGFGGGLGQPDRYPFSAIEMATSYAEIGNRVLSTDFEWEFFEGKLVLDNLPSVGGTLVYEYVKRMTNIIEAQDGSRDQHFIVRYAKADAKERIGRIRRKYDSLPGAEDTLSLDGDRMLDDAAIEKTELTDIMKEEGFPMGFRGA